MTAIDLFVEEARGVSIRSAMDVLPLGTLSRASTTGERIGPCPVCGGTDRFGVNAQRNVWICRGADGGRDAIGLAAHVLGLDVRDRRQFLMACEAVTGQSVPDGHGETEGDRRARQARLEATRAANAKAEADAQAADFSFREQERRKARGKWEAAQPRGIHTTYLAKRLDCHATELPLAPFLRTIVAEPYWVEAEDAIGRKVLLSVYEGCAMVAPFVDGGGGVIGCHLTWIDLMRQPKFRPLVLFRNKPQLTKKMRGTKKGGMIPLIGFVEIDGRILPDLNRPRLAAGEGIENVMAVALAEGPRADTIYCAAGDLGNLSGPADPSSRIRHPELRKPDRNGKMRAVFVKGPIPKADQAITDAMQIFPHTREVLLIGDGDSEIYATASAMARAEARFKAAGAQVSMIWPPRGKDFSDIVAASVVYGG